MKIQAKEQDRISPKFSSLQFDHFLSYNGQEFPECIVWITGKIAFGNIALNAIMTMFLEGFNRVPLLMRSVVVSVNGVSYVPLFPVKGILSFLRIPDIYECVINKLQS